MFSNKVYNWYLGLLSVVFMTIFIIIPLYKHYYGGGLAPLPPNAVDEQIRSELKSEHDRIQPFPGAIFLKTISSIKYGQGAIYSDFSTKSNLQDVLKHYDKELKENGWIFKEITIMRNFGIDEGIRHVVYTKGKYLARIGYYAENERIGETRFSLEVGLHNK